MWRFSADASSLLAGKCLFTSARNCLPMFVARFLLYGTFQNTMLRFLFFLFLPFGFAVQESAGVWGGGVAGGLLSEGWLLAGGGVGAALSGWFMLRIRCDLLGAICGALRKRSVRAYVGGAELGGRGLVAVGRDLAEAGAACEKRMGLVCGRRGW